MHLEHGDSALKVLQQQQEQAKEHSTAARLRSVAANLPTYAEGLLCSQMSQRVRHGICTALSSKHLSLRTCRSLENCSALDSSMQ